jgi:hypothetical protein
VSVNMNLFFNAPGGLGEVAEALSPVLGVQLLLTPDGERYKYQGLGVVMVCFCAEAGDFADDRYMPFSRYGFVLDVVPLRPAGLAEQTWRNLMYYSSMYCFSRITHTLQWPAILVRDMEELVAQFEPPGVSGDSGVPRR